MLQTPYTFLDTEAIVGARFVFDSGPLKRVAELSSSGKLHLIVPEITKKEVQKKIDEHVEELVSKFQRMLAAAPALKALTSNGVPLIAPPDARQLKDRLHTKFQEFLAEAKAESVPFEDGHAQQVLDDYFNHRPPFGPDDKKHQFLDGLALTALKKWAAEEEVQAYVVSRDPDLRSVAASGNTLLPLDTIAQLLELVEIANARAQHLVRSVEDRIKREIADHIPGYGFILDGEDGDVEDVEVVHVELEDLKVQDVEDEVIRFVAQARVTIRADVSYWRSDNATYDSEDGTLFYHDRAEHKVEDKLELQVLGSVIATDSSLTNVAELFVEFDPRGDFLVDAHAVYYGDG